MTTLERAPQPRGNAGIEHSLAKVREFVIKSRESPALLEWATQELDRAGRPSNDFDRAQAILTGVRRESFWVADPVDMEKIQTASHTLCLPDADYCIRGADCDDQTVAFLAAALAIGLQGAIVYQHFADPDGKGGDSDHVIGAVWADGKWWRADPSYQDQLGVSYAPTYEEWTDAVTGVVLCRGLNCPPKDTVPMNTFLSARPVGDFVGLSGVGLSAADSPPPAVAQVVSKWGPWLESAAFDLRDTVANCRSAVKTYRAVREALGRPVGPQAPEGPQEAITSGDLETIEAVCQAGQQIVTYAQEALDQKRSVGWLNDDLVILANPGDKLGVYPDTAQTIKLVDLTGAMPGGTTAGLGIAPLVVVGVAGAVIATTASAYLITRELVRLAESRLEAETKRELTEFSAATIASGADPNQVTQLVGAIGKTGASSRPAEPEPVTSTIKTIAYVASGIALVGAGIWATDRFLPRKKS